MTPMLLVAASIWAAQPSIDDFFSEFVSKREHIQALEAQFVQENKSPDETTRWAGRIVFTKPRQLLFEYFDPKVVYAIDGQRVYQYEAENNQVQIYDIEDSAQADTFFIAFDNKASRLRDAYDVSLEDIQPGDCGSRILKLVPKKPTNADAPAPLYREIRLYLRAEDLLPCRIRAFDEEGAEVSIDIKEYKINPTPAATVQFTVPEGTKIVENEEKFETVGPGGKTLPAKQPAEPPKPAEK